VPNEYQDDPLASQDLAEAQALACLIENFRVLQSLQLRRRQDRRGGFGIGG
jgi:hypothetical protein